MRTLAIGLCVVAFATCGCDDDTGRMERSSRPDLNEGAAPSTDSVSTPTQQAVPIDREELARKIAENPAIGMERFDCIYDGDFTTEELEEMLAAIEAAQDPEDIEALLDPSDCALLTDD